jgi:L-malate glycosyltransferase
VQRLVGDARVSPAAKGASRQAPSRPEPPRCLHSPAVRVDQVIPSLASRDAIGVHTVNLQRALVAAGIDSDIFYGTCTPDMADAGRNVSAIGRHRRERFLLYQASIGSPVFDVLATRSEPKLSNYHNITPPELLAAWEPAVAFEAALGRAQLERLAPECRLAVADSKFNEQELRQAGYTVTAVAPLLIDMTREGAGVDAGVARRLDDQKERGGSDLLYVGKVSPHKAPHDLVKMFLIYRRLYDPNARLHIIGSALGEHYEPALLAFIHDLGLEDAVEVIGSVPPQTLEAYWCVADVYVSASRHEGFCVPIVEAMGHGVPVVAFGAAAVPETVGDAGIVLDSPEPVRFAAAVARAVSDAELRAYLRAAARRRAESFSLDRARSRYVELVRSAVGA